MLKRNKRIFSLLLALVIMVAMGVPSMAAESKTDALADLKISPYSSQMSVESITVYGADLVNGKMTRRTSGQTQTYGNESFPIFNVPTNMQSYGGYAVYVDLFVTTGINTITVTSATGDTLKTINVSGNYPTISFFVPSFWGNSNQIVFRAQNGSIDGMYLYL